MKYCLYVLLAASGLVVVGCESISASPLSGAEALDQFNRVAVGDLDVYSHVDERTYGGGNLTGGGADFARPKARASYYAAPTTGGDVSGGSEKTNGDVPSEAGVIAGNFSGDQTSLPPNRFRNFMDARASEFARRFGGSIRTPKAAVPHHDEIEEHVAVSSFRRKSEAHQPVWANNASPQRGPGLVVSEPPAWSLLFTALAVVVLFGYRCRTVSAAARR